MGRKVNIVHFGLVGLAAVAGDLGYAFVPSTIASAFSLIAGRGGRGPLWGGGNDDALIVFCPPKDPPEIQASDGGH